MFKRQHGQSLSEYIGVTALVAIAGIAAITLFSTNLQTQFGNLAREITGSSEQIEERSSSSAELLDIYNPDDDPDDTTQQSQDSNSDDIEAEGVEVAAWPWIGQGAVKALECAKNPSCRKAVKEGAKQAVKKGRDALNRSKSRPNKAQGDTKRPSGFRKQTVQDAWDKAAPGSKQSTKACPTCSKDVKVAPGQGRRDWDVDHQPSWSKRDLPSTRKGVLDNYNTGTRLECPGCNRSRGAGPLE